MGILRNLQPLSLHCSKSSHGPVRILIAAILVAGTVPAIAGDEDPAHEIELHLTTGAREAAQTVRATRGHPLTLLVTTDTEAELHVHGLDVSTHARPGEATKLTVQARVTGRFPVTMHDAGGGHATVLYIEIHPD